jgi:hypothetical protein
MFDIRLARYVTEADSAKSDFWGSLLGTDKIVR